MTNGSRGSLASTLTVRQHYDPEKDNEPTTYAPGVFPEGTSRSAGSESQRRSGGKRPTATETLVPNFMNSSDTLEYWVRCREAELRCLQKGDTDYGCSERKGADDSPFFFAERSSPALMQVRSYRVYLNKNVIVISPRDGLRFSSISSGSDRAEIKKKPEPIVRYLRLFFTPKLGLVPDWSLGLPWSGDTQRCSLAFPPMFRNCNVTRANRR
jgi:hypothetical protein